MLKKFFLRVIKTKWFWVNTQSCAKIGDSSKKYRLMAALVMIALVLSAQPSTAGDDDRRDRARALTKTERGVLGVISVVGLGLSAAEFHLQTMTRAAQASVNCDVCGPISSLVGGAPSGCFNHSQQPSLPIDDCSQSFCCGNHTLTALRWLTVAAMFTKGLMALEGLRAVDPIGDDVALNLGPLEITYRTLWRFRAVSGILAMTSGMLNAVGAGFDPEVVFGLAAAGCGSAIVSVLGELASQSWY